MRDALMGLFYSKDFDFVVEQKFDETIKAFANKTGGKVITWDFLQTRIVYYENGAHVSVDFAQSKGSDIAGDLKKRDFTINALAIDLKSLFSDTQADIMDVVNGRDDLEKKIIRNCSTAAFDDDPLRILRGIRFAREFDFEIDPQTFTLMRDRSHLLARVSRERIKKEFFTILSLPGIENSLHELLTVGAFKLLIPELDGFAGILQSYPHQDNLLEHSLITAASLELLLNNLKYPFNKYIDSINTCLDETIEEGVTRRSLLMFSELMHDCGKTKTCKINDNKITFYGHDIEGAALNKEIAKRLGLGRYAQRLVEQITKKHMRILQLSLLDAITERAKFRLVRDSEEIFWEIILLSIADAMATGNDNAYASRVKDLEDIAHDLVEKRYSNAYEINAQPLLTGNEIM
ncbi:MAG: HD domain-containing protein, partial [Pseudomonadota bacterium]